MNQTNISDVPSITFVHDCDVGANNTIQELGSTANVLYDPKKIYFNPIEKIDTNLRIIVHKGYITA